MLCPPLLCPGRAPKPSPSKRNTRTKNHSTSAETQTPVRQPSTPTGPRKTERAGPGPPGYIPPPLPMPAARSRRPCPLLRSGGTERIFFFFFAAHNRFSFSLYPRPSWLRETANGRRGDGRYKGGLVLPCHGEACCSMLFGTDPCRDGTTNGREKKKENKKGGIGCQDSPRGGPGPWYPCPSSRVPPVRARIPSRRGGRVRYPARLPSIRVALVSRRRTGLVVPYPVRVDAI